MKFPERVTVQEKKQFTVAELASLANVSRVTLYRYLKQGILSFQTDAVGNKIIEASEAYRWLSSYGVAPATTVTASVKQPDTSPEVEALQREILLLREIIAARESDLQSKDVTIEEQQKRLLLLEDLRQQGTGNPVTRQEVASTPTPEVGMRTQPTRHEKKPRTLLDRLTDAAGAFLS